MELLRLKHMQGISNNQCLKGNFPVSSELSDLCNCWLHPICACTEWYSRSCIPQEVAVPSV